jgi:hypothetical protein
LSNRMMVLSILKPQMRKPLKTSKSMEIRFKSMKRLGRLCNACATWTESFSARTQSWFLSTP